MDLDHHLALSRYRRPPGRRPASSRLSPPPSALPPSCFRPTTNIRPAPGHSRAHGKPPRFSASSPSMPCWHLALYDDFAWFYNRYWNEEFHSLAFPILERIWLPRLPRKGRILDVCCGTGYLAGLLTARGYRVTGIDASAGDDRARPRERARPPRSRWPTPASSGCSASSMARSAPSTASITSSSEEDLQRRLRTHRGGAETGRAVRLRHAAGIRLPDQLDGRLLPGARRPCAGALRLGLRLPHASGAVPDHDVPPARRRVAAQRRGSARNAATPRARSTPHLRRAGFEGTACYDARDLGMSGQLGQGRTFVITTKGDRV